MKILISYESKIQEIRVEEYTSITVLKKILEKLLNVKKEYQILSNKNSDFIYENTIAENNFGEGDTLYVMNTEKKSKIHLCGFIF
jgi:hypothetical protein